MYMYMYMYYSHIQYESKNPQNLYPTLPYLNLRTHYTDIHCKYTL